MRHQVKLNLIHLVEPPFQAHHNFQNSHGYAPPYAPPPKRNLEETLHAFIEKQEAINTQLAQGMTDFKDTPAKLTSALSFQEKGKFPSQPQQNPKGQYNANASGSRSQYMDQVKSVITLRCGKVIEKPILKPCEKDDESIYKGKEGVEPEHCKEKTDFPPTLPFPHAMTKQRKVNHNSEIVETFKQSLNLGELKPTFVTLLLADRSVKVPREIVEDVYGLMKLSFGNMTLEINIFNICKQLGDDNDLQEVDHIEELVHDQLESTLSKIELDEYEDLQMIYSWEEITDEKGTKNINVDLLSRVTTDLIFDIPPIDDYSPDESLLSLSSMPWFAKNIIFLPSGDLPAHWSTEDKGKFLNEVKNFYWDDLNLFKYYPDKKFQRCIPDNEVNGHRLKAYFDKFPSENESIGLNDLVDKDNDTP
ncbi:hypothetical protein D5086_013165 [Populus alba]|uniref:Uncharacterized protein n=1 Tax=Populus alba TaxID=43335 RepID=A0ACC4C4X9_POPAL